MVFAILRADFVHAVFGVAVKTNVEWWGRELLGAGELWGRELLAAGVRHKTIKAWTLDPVVQYGDMQSPTSKSIWDTLEDMDAQACMDKCVEIDSWRPLRKPKFGKVGKTQPGQKGLNFYLKCLQAPTKVADSEEIKEVLCGDDTGCVVVSIRSDVQAALCKEGAAIRVHAHVRMVKGFIRLTVDKWAVLKSADSLDFEKVNATNNVSKVEYELS